MDTSGYPVILFSSSRQLQQGLLSHVKYIGLINGISIQCYIEGHWISLLICPLCWNRIEHKLAHWGRDKMGRYFADTFKRIFMNKNVRISINISLKFVPKGLINNIPALVQIMAWRRPGDKPLSEPMMVSLLTHICVTQPQWVNPVHVKFFRGNISSSSSSSKFYFQRNTTIKQ